MVITGSLQLSHGLGLCKNQGYEKRLKSGIGRPKLDLFGSTLSSRFSFQRQNSWNVHVPDIVHRPVHSLPYRHNAFKCHSFLPSGIPLELPQLKTTAVALTRSVQGSPLLLKLAIAASITVFAAWGLVPLIRLIRNLILHKNDNSWKKSNTHYIMTSYLQPMLLWIGAMLICRALDPVVLPTEASQIVKLRLLTFVRSLSTVLAFAYCLSSVIQQTQKFFMETNHDSSDTRNMGFHFAGKAVYSAVWIAAFSLFMELLGFSTQKWVTAGGFGTVLLTLAGREIFTNFLSSAMIHATRPFVVNEWIQTKIEGYEVSGTVEHVGWWSPTIVRGEDREAVHIPNHKFTVNVVRNLTQKTHWRVKTHLAISHLDVNKINNIVADMRKVLAKNPQVEQQRLHRRVFLENVNAENQALMILISCFVKTSHFEEYLCVKEAILLDLLRVISHHRARLATPIRTVQKIFNSDSISPDLENVPFADSVYSRSGVSNRPLLLIEPAYKVNGKTSAKTKETTDSKLGDKVAAKSESESDNGATNSSPTGKQPKSSGSGNQKSSSSASETVAESPDSKSGNKVAAKSESESENGTINLSPNGKQPKNGGSGNQKSSPPSETVSEASDSKSGDKVAAKSESESDNGTISSTSNGKQPKNSSSGNQKSSSSEIVTETRPPVSKPSVLEENIVLGVALEGSKRTLPIEDNIASLEVTEMAGRVSGQVSPTQNSSDKDKREGQIPSSPSSSTSVDT